MNFSSLYGEVNDMWKQSVDLISQQPSVPITQYDSTDSKQKQKGKHKSHSTWHKMVDGAENLADDALDGIEAIGNEAENLGKDVYHGVVNVSKGAYHAGEELAQTDLGKGIVNMGENVFHGVENVGSDIFSGVENLGESALNDVKNVGHRIGNIGSDIEHIVLVGGGLLLAGAILWSSKEDNRQWAYEKGEQLYQKGKTAAKAAIVL